MRGRVSGATHHECNKLYLLSFPLCAMGNKQSRVIISVCLAAESRRAQTLEALPTEAPENCAWKFNKLKRHSWGDWQPAPGVVPAVRALLAFWRRDNLVAEASALVPPESGGVAAGFSLRR